MRSYCIYCKTGSERSLAGQLAKDVRELHGYEVVILFPQRVLHERKKGVWHKVEQPLMPGYLFLYMEDEDLFFSYLVKQERDVYKVLRYSDGSMQLKAGDEQYARWLWNHNGKLEPSKVVFEEGQPVKVISGPLMDMDGRIVKMDRHKKRAVVAFMFAGEERTMNLSVEAIDSAQE